MPNAKVGSVLHWVEGELNAHTLSLPPYRQHAEGFPGADAWNDEWLEHAAGVFRHVLWYDEDTSGRAARERVTKKLAERHGDGWVLQRLRHVHTPPGKDANALHVEGRLAPIIRAAEWIDPPGPGRSSMDDAEALAREFFTVMPGPARWEEGEAPGPYYLSAARALLEEGSDGDTFREVTRSTPLASGYKSKSRNWLHVDSSGIASFAREKACGSSIFSKRLTLRICNIV
jgi:hypothetical protein